MNISSRVVPLFMLFVNNITSPLPSPPHFSEVAAFQGPPPLNVGNPANLALTVAAKGGATQPWPADQR